MNRHGWFEKPDHVVTDVANRAAYEMRNVSWRYKLKTGECFLQLTQRIALAVGAVENHQRIEPDKGKASEFLVAFGRFEKKTRLTVVDFWKGRNRRLDIRDKIDNQGNEVAAFREIAKLVPRGRNRMWKRCGNERESGISLRQRQPRNLRLRKNRTAPLFVSLFMRV